MRLAGVLSLLILGCCAASSSACTVPRHGDVVARTGHSWIAWRSIKPPPASGYDQARRWTACRQGHRPVILATTGSEPYGGEEVRFARLAGRYAGLVLVHFDHYGGGTQFIQRFDLARRRALFQVFGGSSGEFGESGGVLDMRMSARGDIAWLRNDYGTGTQLVVLDTTGARTLDSDPQPTGLSRLRVRGDAISWQRASEQRTASFAPAPTWCPLGAESHVFARSDDAWVAVAPGSRVLGCLRGQRPVLITRADDGTFATTDNHVRAAVVRGTLAGVWIAGRLNASGAKGHLILRADLQHPTMLPPVEAFRSVQGSYDQGLSAFDMDPAGDLAWIANEDNNHNHVVLMDGLGRRIVDSAGPGSMLRDLHVDGDSVLWTHDGEPRTAAFNR
jgi:hypothetical protein